MDTSLQPALLEVEASHEALVEQARRWLLRHGCSLVVTEMATSAREEADAIGWCHGEAILIECKTSRSDFQADRRKVFRQIPEEGLGAKRFYLAPRGLIAPEELPDRWGLLEYHKGRLFMVRDSHWFEHNGRGEALLLISCLRRIGRLLGDQPIGGISTRVYLFDADKCSVGIDVGETPEEDR